MWAQSEHKIQNLGFKRGVSGKSVFWAKKSWQPVRNDARILKFFEDMQF